MNEAPFTPEDEDEEALGLDTAPDLKNRNFLYALGILGLVFVVTLVTLTALWAARANSQALQMGAIRATNAAVLAQNTQVVAEATADEAARIGAAATASWTQPPVLTATPVLALATPTSTQRGVEEELSPTEPRPTQTQTAAFAPSGTPARLPETGIAEDLGLTATLSLALVLLAVIVVARRLRLARA